MLSNFENNHQSHSDSTAQALPHAQSDDTHDEQPIDTKWGVIHCDLYGRVLWISWGSDTVTNIWVSALIAKNFFSHMGKRVWDDLMSKLGGLPIPWHRTLTRVVSIAGDDGHHRLLKLSLKQTQVWVPGTDRMIEGVAIMLRRLKPTEFRRYTAMVALRNDMDETRTQVSDD